MDRNEKNNSCNAFIVTRLGQLRNVHALIEQESLEHNVLVIMYVKHDTALFSNLKAAYREEMFDDVLYLELPNSPLRLTKKRSEAIYAGMEDILKTVHDEYSAKELYLCNIDNYYVYLERIIADHGYSMAINLFEEGLTTYKITSGESLKKKENPPNKNDIKKAWIDCKKALKKFILNAAVLLLHCAGFLVRKPLVTCARNLWSRLTVDKRRRYGIIRDFNKAYVCFPEMVNGTDALHFASVEKLNFKFNRVEDEDLKTAAAGYSTLFVNQKYINYESHFRILFQIFDEMGIDKVLIKLHPKEKEDQVAERICKMQTEYTDIDVKILSSTGSIPVEDIIYSLGIQRVIGLTSSALIYLQSGLDAVEVISIAERYRTLCAGDDLVASRELILFDDEYRFFKRFENITQFVPDSDRESEKDGKNPGDAP